MISGVTLSPKLLTDVISLKQLPLTLYTKTHITATGYSKVSRGLRFPPEIPGLCTMKEYSGDSRLGQWRSRYTIHAGRHSNGKAFRSRLLLSLRRVTDHWNMADIHFCISPYIAARIGLYLHLLPDVWRIVSEDSSLRKKSFLLIVSTY